MLIDIDAARDRGILPIAFRGKDKFVSNGLDESDAAEEETAEEETAESKDAEMSEESDEESDE